MDNRLLGGEEVVAEGPTGFFGILFDDAGEWYLSFQGGEIMRKGFVVLLAAVVVVMFAMPAMAGTEVTGFYRTKGYVSNFKDSSGGPAIQKDAPSNAYVEQRLRVRFAFGEENVKAVWFSEIDFNWGDQAGGSLPIGAAGAGRNTGGALGADRINLETKNIFVWFKLPNTSLDFTVGLQNQTDAYAGLIFGAADMAGIFVNGKVEPITYKLGFAKLYENNVSKSDDLTLYIASVGFVPVKDARLGVNLYFLQDDTGKVSNVNQLPSDPGGSLTKARVYYPGIDAAFKVGPATLSGFFVYNTGKEEAVAPFVAPDLDVKGFAADIRADANLGPGKLFVEGLYLSGGDGSGNEYKSLVTLSDVNASPGGNSFFARTDMSILLSNADDINTNQALIGAAGSASSQSPGNAGRGIWHVAAGYTQKLGDKLTAKVGAGHLRATKLLISDASFRDKTMGTEVNANLNYNIMKGLDFGVYGAYAWLGDFFLASASDDPDDPFDVHFRLNYAF
jgi:hypothetical protein